MLVTQFSLSLGPGKMAKADFWFLFKLNVQMVWFQMCNDIFRHTNHSFANVYNLATSFDLKRMSSSGHCTRTCMSTETKYKHRYTLECYTNGVVPFKDGLVSAKE